MRKCQKCFHYIVHTVYIKKKRTVTIPVISVTVDILKVFAIVVTKCYILGLMLIHWYCKMLWMYCERIMNVT